MKQDIIQKLKEIIAEAETNQPDPYAELKEAHAAGKVIQVLSGGVWYDLEVPAFGASYKEYRIKPEEPWTLTPQQVAEGWIEHHGGENPVPGKRVEVMLADHTTSKIEWNWNWKHNAGIGNIIAYRVIAEKKLIPLEPDDVPPGSVLEDYYKTGWLSIIDVTLNGVTVVNEENTLTTYTFFEIMSDPKCKARINRSIPLTGKWDATAWEPCSKEQI